MYDWKIILWIQKMNNKKWNYDHELSFEKNYAKLMPEK